MVTTFLLYAAVIIVVIVSIVSLVHRFSPKGKEYLDTKVFTPVSKWFVGKGTQGNQAGLSQDDTRLNGPVVEQGSYIHPLLKFFAWYGGADIALLRELPSAVVGKRATFGAAMFISIIFSSIVTFVVWSDIKGTFFGTSAMFLWFALITGLERALMTLMDEDRANAMSKPVDLSQTKSERIISILTSKLMLVMTVRVVLIFAMTTLNSQMMEMQVFDTEIMSQITAERQVRLNHLNDSIAVVEQQYTSTKTQLQRSYEQKNQAYQQVIAAKEQRIDAMRDSLLSEQNKLTLEIEGLVGSGYKGYGPAAQAKREAIARDSAMLESMKSGLDSTRKTIPEYVAMQHALEDKTKGWADADAAIANLHAERQVAVNQLKSQKVDGFLDRYTAMGRIADGAFLRFLFFCVCFAFEALPIILKLMSSDDLLTEAMALQAAKYRKDHHYQADIDTLEAKNNFIEKSGQLKNRQLVILAETANNRVTDLKTLSAAQKNRFGQIKKNVDELDPAIEDINIDPAAKLQLRNDAVVENIGL